ncbi:MAG TPA: hypothetical protein VHN11_07955 [Xanthobacteraceae bacterium]|jgi:hypothetical protein|nr:hypothetical protein [Xanthobacteraceae bacterium]
MHFSGILDPVSNREDWVQLIEVMDEDTGESIDISGASIVVEVRDPISDRIVISATTANGAIGIIDTGAFQISIGKSLLRCLPAKNYEIGATITINDETRQLILGTLPIADGIVTQ